VKLPKHIALTIDHNEHACWYQTAEEYFAEHGEPDWQSEESRERALETDSVWIMVWHPDTPAGFHCIAAPTLEELLAYAEEVSRGTRRFINDRGKPGNER